MTLHRITSLDDARQTQDTLYALIHVCLTEFVSLIDSQRVVSCQFLILRLRGKFLIDF